MPTKTRLLSVLISVLFSTALAAQLDTSFTLLRFGKPGVFTYKKIGSPLHFRNIDQAELPLYAFNENQFARIKSLLSLFVINETEFMKMRDNFNQKDSVYQAKIHVYNQVDSLQSLRVKNFETAYNDLLKVSGQYNEELIKCRKVAMRQNRKTRWLAGGIGLGAGLIGGIFLGLSLK